MRVIAVRASIFVRDLDAALDFYSGHLGLPLSLRGEDFALVGPARGAGQIALRTGEFGTRSSETPPRTKIGFLVDADLESAIADLRAVGAGEFDEIDDRGLVRFAFFDDPDGNALYLLEAPAMGADRDRGDGYGQRAPLVEHLGIRWLELNAEEVALEIDLTDDLRGPAGALLGGVTTTLIDFAAAMSATLAAETSAVATTHMAVDFLAPGRAGPIRATARTLGGGDDDRVSRVEVIDEQPAPKTIATGDVHFALLRDSRGSVRE